MDTITMEKLNNIAIICASGATIIYTLMTGRIVWINTRVLKLNVKALEMDNYLKIKNDLTSSFINEFCKFCLENNFLIRYSDKVQAIEILASDLKRVYDESEFRNKILHPFEVLAIIYQNKIITIDTINSGFGTTILILGSSSEFRKYILYLRKEDKKLGNGAKNSCCFIQNKFVMLALST